jgi:hypothetical protein
VKLGAEPRKVGLLVALLATAAFLLYRNLFSGPAGPEPARRPALLPEVATPPEVGRPVPRAERRSAARANLQDFRPSLRPRRGSERGDLRTIDPTLRLDLLARLKKVDGEYAGRSLFEFSAAPLPKVPEPKIIPKAAAGIDAAKVAGEEKPAEEVKPPPPRIPLKFYGYVAQARQGAKRAFFLDGDDILVADEGEVLKKRYRLVRVGISSAVVEDIEHHNEQTLPLEAQAG